MNVDPTYAAVGQFFGYRPIYVIPKYQRGYAWDRLEIDDFVKDLGSCFQKRVAGGNQNHFFGGIVSVKKPVQGAVNQHSYELVDGQQRMATFTLLVSAMIKIYSTLLRQVTTAGDLVNKGIIENRIQDLKLRFVEFQQEINRITNVQEVITLSRSDRQFYKDLIGNQNPTPSRDSHHRIKYAYETIIQKLDALTNQPAINDKLDRLEIVKNIIDNDFSILHIVTYDKNEAYRLFQVLNDRGKNLTEGDLLRAKTLELLEAHPAQQDSVELLWDEILADKPSLTEDFLRWIYASHSGDRAGSSTLFDDFLTLFYPSHNSATTTAVEAGSILSATQELRNEINHCRKLINGEWPLPLATPVTGWDRNRLALLIKELGHTLSMPLLLASCKLDHVKLSDTVHMIEKFAFRYIIITNQHATALANKYHEECLAIRTNPTGYNIASLRTKLQALQTQRANDGLFRASLDSLIYKVGGGNTPIKYFLLTIESFLRWYRAGATGTPQCMDKTVIYDFTDTTIEHVYPRNAQGVVVDATLEDLKNTIGNLTFLGPSDNLTGGNDSFNVKRPIFAASSVLMNREISQKTQWHTATVLARANELKDIALRIFTV